MRAKFLLFASVMAIGAAALPTASAAAQSQFTSLRSAVEQARVRPIQQNILSRGEVIRIVRDAMGGGEPMGVPELEPNGRFYIVRWRRPNEVVEVLRVDAITGQISR